MASVNLELVPLPPRSFVTYYSSEVTQREVSTFQTSTFTRIIPITFKSSPFKFIQEFRIISINVHIQIIHSFSLIWFTLPSAMVSRVAFSMRSAWLSSDMYRSIITELSNSAVGLARSLPAMSGAVPCTWDGSEHGQRLSHRLTDSNSAPPFPILPLGVSLTRLVCTSLSLNI